MSFSAEMKDFLNAYKTGQSINASRTDQDYKEAQTDATKKKTDRDNDPEGLQLDTDIKKQQLATSKASAGTSAMNAQTQRMSIQDQIAQRAWLRSQAGAPQPGSGLGIPTNPVGPGGPVPQGQGALPLPVRTDMQDDTSMYADGGLVPDEDTDPNDADDQGAVPLNTPTPANAPTDVSARSRGLNGVIAPTLVRDATKAGLNYGAKEYGLLQTGAIQTPAQQARAQQFVQGHGGLTPDEMEAARKAVDPENKLSDAQRNAAALGSVYQFWANKGEPDKAARVAFQMLQHYRVASQRYAAIAAKAAEGGNVDLATKAAMKAYANVPDGNDMELMANPDGGIMYAMTGPNGDVVTKGIVTPQQLYAQASGLASGGFDKALLTAAGQAENTGAVKPAGGKTQSTSDRAKEAEITGEAVNKLKDKWVEKNKDKPVDDEFWQQTTDVAQHVLQQNPKATASEAARAAQLLIAPGAKDPEKPDFKVKMGGEGEQHTVTFGSGLKIKLDDDQLEAINNARAARVKLAADKISSDTEEADKPGFLDKAGKAASAIGSAIGNIASDAAPAVSTMGRIAKGAARGAIPDELYERVGSDVPNMAGVIADKFRNKGAIPVDDNDRPL